MSLTDPRPPPPSGSIATGRRVADTTEEQDRKTAGQRTINKIWEITQAFVTVAITVAEIYAQLNKIDSKMLDAAFFAVITTYLARTNHSKIGGVGGGLEPGTR